MQDRVIYPVIIDTNPGNDGYFIVSIPAVDGMTQGTSVENAIDMAREYVGEIAVDYREEGHELPTSIYELPNVTTGQIATLVDIDIKAFLKRHDNRMIKKTLTIPAILDDWGIQNGLNFSATLAEAIEDKMRHA